MKNEHKFAVMILLIKKIPLNLPKISRIIINYIRVFFFNLLSRTINFPFPIEIEKQKFLKVDQSFSPTQLVVVSDEKYICEEYFILRMLHKHSINQTE